MTHLYFDSSALVKRYVTEVGTQWINDLCEADSGHTLYTVRISGAEIVAAFFLRVRTGTLSTSDAELAATQFKADFRSDYQIVEVTELLVDSAMALAEKHQLRGYDSVQLAAAVALQNTRTSYSLSPLTFICADERLNKVASAAGLLVENPNEH